MADESSSLDDIDIYSEDVDQMDFKVINVAVLALLSGFLGIVVTAMNFSIGFFASPLIFLIATVSHLVLTGTAGFISLIAGWGLWRLEPWAWRTALAVSVVALILSLLVLSIVLIAINAVLIYFLRDRELKDIYNEIILP